MIQNAKNRADVAANVDEYIEKIENGMLSRRLRITAVFDDLSIFDWWNDYLSLSQLKEMKMFLRNAGGLGYNGYVCFKVGAAGCSHGMWAYKKESTDGHSPDGEALYHSFRSGDNYWDARLPDGRWMHEKYEMTKYKFTLKEVKAELA